VEQIVEARPEQLRPGSAVSWPAIFAGAFVAASVSLVLLVLGSGLGFDAASPWPGHGASAAKFAIATAIWLIVMQWISSGVGGYITGRLRTRWLGTHTHEVFFRDTAHGLVMWSVATVLVAAAAATSVFTAIEGGARAVAGGAHAAALSDAAANPYGGDGLGVDRLGGDKLHEHALARAYSIDKLFRSTGSSSSAASSDPRLEAAHVAANAWSEGGVSDADRSYLAELVAARTGASPADARKRVDEFAAAALDAQAKARADFDAGRKAAAEAAIYTALSMLVGAFIASVSASLGGRLRDRHYL